MVEADTEAVFTIRDDNPIYTFPFDRRAAPLPPQQAQAYALQPTVATLAQGPALSTPQPIPVAVAVAAPPQHSGAPVAFASGGY